MSGAEVGGPRGRRPPAARKDASRNREALLSAARELMLARSDVPLYEVARRAGVGQATLYRHFPDRAALATAVAEENMAVFEAEVAAVPAGPRALEQVLRLSAAVIAWSGALIEVVLQATEPGPEGDSGDRAPVVSRLQQRFAQLFEEPLRQARAAGRVGEGLGPQEVMFALSMVWGAIEVAGDDPAQRRAAAERAVEIVLHGLLLPASERSGR